MYKGTRRNVDGDAVDEVVADSRDCLSSFSCTNISKLFFGAKTFQNTLRNLHPITCRVSSLRDMPNIQKSNFSFGEPLRASEILGCWSSDKILFRIVEVSEYG
jgi:hypothetical protein